MSKIKSIRFSDMSINMLESIRDYYKNMGISGIIELGLSQVFRLIADENNNYFKIQMHEILIDNIRKKDKYSISTLDLFDRICSTLEPISLSDGRLLKYEIRNLLHMLINKSAYYNDMGTSRYTKLWDTIFKTEEENRNAKNRINGLCEEQGIKDSIYLDLKLVYDAIYNYKRLIIDEGNNTSCFENMYEEKI